MDASEELVFVSSYSYEGQREDILSFSKGQLMLVQERPCDTWWVAELDSGEVGYVPAAYLKEFTEESRMSRAGSPPPIRSPPLKRCENRRKPEIKSASSEQSTGALRWVSGNPLSLPRLEQQDWDPMDLGEFDPRVSERKREAMHQLMARIQGAEWEHQGATKPLEDVLTPPQLEDVHQIESKRLTNPMLESQPHKQLQLELKLRNKRGELLNERSELDRILHIRKRETDLNQLRGHSDTSHHLEGTSPADLVSKELLVQLQKRTKHLQQVEDEERADQSKPEFLKIKLRKAPTS